MKLFHSFDTMDWGRVALVVAAISGGWLVLGEIIPKEYHYKGTIIIQAITTTATLMMRSGKSRGEIIGDKIEEHQVDGEKKAEEIKTLVVSELKERAEKP